MVGTSGLFTIIVIWRFFVLNLLKEPVDVMLSHDWPQDVWEFGDKRSFLRRKPFLKSEIERGEFGSPPLKRLMETLQPRLWFSSHMHCRFEAQVGKTYFLALDKCLPNREFLEIIEICPSSSSSSRQQESMALQYDPEWLSILQSTRKNQQQVGDCAFLNMILDNPMHVFDESHNHSIPFLRQDLPIADAVTLHYNEYCSRFGLDAQFTVQH